MLKKIHSSLDNIRGSWLEDRPRAMLRRPESYTGSLGGTVSPRCKPDAALLAAIKGAGIFVETCGREGGKRIAGAPAFTGCEGK